MSGIDAIIPDFLGDAVDDPNVREDDAGGSHVRDPVEEFFKIAQLGAFLGPDGFRHAHNLAVESAEIDAPIREHYRKIAEADGALAKRKIETDELVRSAALLAKPVGAPLNKSDLTFRMRSLLTKLRPDCADDELRLLEKAIAALDVSAFVEITEGIISRLKEVA